MTRKIISFDKFFKVIWQPYEVKFYNISIETLNATRVNVSMNKIHFMQELDAFCYLRED